jgi:phosphate transport system protein
MALEPELQRLHSEVWALGRIVESALVESIEMLQRRSPPAAESLIIIDHEISRKRFSVEMDCLSLIVAQQPLDGELRAIAAILEIVSELEHIGRYITDIARIHVVMANLEEPLSGLLTATHRMATTTQLMLQRALKAFAERDVALAQAVHSNDSEVDALYRHIYGQILEFMKGESRAMVKQARYLAQIVRNLERTADRVTNTCEWVVFAATGEMMGAGENSVEMYWEEPA